MRWPTPAQRASPLHALQGFSEGTKWEEYSTHTHIRFSSFSCTQWKAMHRRNTQMQQRKKTAAAHSTYETKQENTYLAQIHIEA